MSIMDVYDIPFDDQKVYDWICEGKTALLFQIGSFTLQKWGKKFKPRNILELAALIAIVRPGVLNTRDDEGVSMAEHICRRKHGEEPSTPLHPILDRSTKSTWGTLLYQEQLLTICEDVCGWTRIKGLDLMKAVAKKQMDKIIKLKKDFVADATALGRVNEADATKIYESMEASGRYLFNLSHSVEYAVMAYVTAYYKYYKLQRFYYAALKHTKSEQKPKEEVKIIYGDMVNYKIDILPPHLLKSKGNFSIEDGVIRYGLTNIAGLGDSNYKTLRKSIKSIEKRIGKSVSDCSWYEFLINFCHKNKKITRLTPSVVGTLIEAGALDFFGVHRKRMAYEAKSWQDLSEAEHAYAIENYKECDNVLDLVKKMMVPIKEGGAAKSNRIEIIESVYRLLEEPPMSLEDTVDWIIAKERKLLGVNLTASRLDKFDTKWVNAYVGDFNNCDSLPNPSYFAVEIEEVVKTTTKKGKNPGQEMVRLKVRDDSGATKTPCFLVFPKVYQQVADLCEEGNVVVINGEVSKDGDALFVNEMSLL